MRAKLLAMILAAAVGVPAAGALVTSNDVPEPTTTSTTTLAATETTQPSIDADLVAACTTDGLKLVAKEKSRQITVIEQSALDALRPICEAAGYELPGTPQQETAPVIVQEMTIEASGKAPATTAATTQASGDHEEQESEHQDSENDD